MVNMALTIIIAITIMINMANIIDIISHMDIVQKLPMRIKVGEPPVQTVFPSGMRRRHQILVIANCKPQSIS